ncbi:hypothetical protein RUM44_005567 [Polyplax serrata]|uniref:Uncharacterized protein n=1 Tax=Polyplax serrata TaxID=468196 RepID=A0ABR1ADR3_POLSC
MNFKKKKNLINLLEWIVAIVAGAALAGISDYGDLVSNNTFGIQLIDATVYGYLMISSLVFLTLCFGNEIPENTGYAISGMGFILYALTAILLPFCSTLEDVRVVVCLAFCAANAVLYAIEFFLSLFNKNALS